MSAFSSAKANTEFELKFTAPAALLLGVGPHRVDESGEPFRVAHAAARAAGERAARGEKAEVDFEADAWQTVSDDAKDLLAKMLTASPDDRITSTDACSHPWFK